MAENLAYLPAVSPSSDGSESSPFYYVYNYEGSSINDAKSRGNYTAYGVLYNWEAAKTACPTGWHLPTDEEWTPYFMAGTIGKNQTSNNSSGFTALPGGYWTDGGGFGYLGYYAYFWSSSEDGSYAWHRELYYDNVGVYPGDYYRRFGYSVRCLKDN
jgi:hypothetical protein